MFWLIFEFNTDRQSKLRPCRRRRRHRCESRARLLLFYAVVGSRCSPVPLDTAWGLGGHLEPLRGMSASSIKGFTPATWSKHVLRGWVLSINTPHARLSSEQIKNHVRSYAVEGSFMKKDEAGRNIIISHQLLRVLTTELDGTGTYGPKVSRATSSCAPFSVYTVVRNNFTVYIWRHK